jgi:hypothetical protein
MGRRNALIALLAGVASAISAGTTLVVAAPQAAEDGTDTFNVAKGTTVNATNSGNVTISAATSFGTLVVTCTLSTWSGKTGTTLKFVITPPTFTDAAAPQCTDNFGFNDTITSNSTNGNWFVKEKDFSNKGAGDEGLPEPNATGDKMQIHIPQAGVVDSNSSASGCTITAAPSGPVNLTGKYDDAGTLKVSNASVPVSISAACPASGSGTATVSMTYKLSPAIFDVG